MGHVFGVVAKVSGQIDEENFYEVEATVGEVIAYGVEVNRMVIVLHVGVVGASTMSIDYAGVAVTQSESESA